MFIKSRKIEIMKKIFILTGEPSGDKLAAEAIAQLKKKKLITFNIYL